ncbi:quinol:cytochrome C oxidoreductase [Urechidicola croceus]|uniref:Quinol:cytochrome C oxidoreductase n=1 Tax=Urechidicola croceus TaxID=1850246 RepID=A0A1D8PAB7_9FLAO|nr:quinol:cytochrome C oxidoreductase [Urechidicola croceus]AOW21490.1 quinol:cytochrome C oxidoreductase [Urechidicola croceus]
MYTFSNRLKTFSFALMIVGLIGITWGFLNTPSTIEEAKEIVAHNSQDSHGSSHEVIVDTHDTTVNDLHGESTAHEEGHDASHDEHVFHQLKNRPWSALYVAIFFFMMLALGTLAFYAIQHAAQAGWSIVLFRVMEGITAYLPIGAVILFLFLVLSGMHMNHVFAWMAHDPSDELLANKAGYLNVPFLLIRSAIYIAGWIWYRQYSKKQTRLQDEASEGDNTHYRKLFKASAAFLVFFLVTESMMSWDWIMSIDHHWFSTLFGWYIFAGMFVSAITTIALVTIYLKSRGYLEYVNDSHLHDLAKFMFGFSIFWTYLWFSQFMLIWYANIPEEVTYYVQRFEEYKVPFLGMLAMNFAFPILLLMNSDYKRLPWFIVMAGIVVLIGHYVDVYIMITPGSVGSQWSFISPEVIGAALFFLGLFIFIVFTALTKAPLKAKGNPFIKESEQYHY